MLVTMTPSIKVFVKGTWIIKPFGSDSFAWVYGGWPPQHRFEKFVSKNDVLALRVAREVAEESGLRLRVYDLAGLRGWIFAHVNKVRLTPTIIINAQRIEGVPSKDELLHKLNRKPKRRGTRLLTVQLAMLVPEKEAG